MCHYKGANKKPLSGAIFCKNEPFFGYFQERLIFMDICFVMGYKKLTHKK